MESEGYPKVTHQYLKALYCFPNLYAPACAPNLYLPVPGRPAWLEKPLMFESLEFRRSLQILENGGDLALDQAIALQAQSAIKSDQRLTEIDQETRDFLSGAAAALATVQLRDPSLRAKLPLITRALSSECHDVLLESIGSVLQTGPAPDMVLKPVKYYILEKGEEMNPGQV